MSTQSTPSILFTHNSAQQPFRLLELSPELAELLSSDCPPTLELKSPCPVALSTTATASQAQQTPTPAADFVNLCTPTATYSIRQVQSSNSLHVLQPSSGGSVRRHDLSIVGGPVEEGEEMDVDTEMEGDRELNLNIEGTVTTIAKCGSTLELHTPAEGFSALPFLRSLLRVFEEGMDVDMEEVVPGSESTLVKRSVLDRLFADVPVSRAQCELAWVELCAFVLIPREMGDDAAGPMLSRYWRPSAGMKLYVWKRAVDGAVLQGIDLRSQFLVKDLWRSVLEDDGIEPFPWPLFEAVIRRICEAESGVSVGSGMKWASIDQESCVRWVGETYLEAMAPTAASSIGQSEYTNAWKDQLPESWRENVSLSILPNNCYMHPEPKTICFATEVDRQKVKKNLSTDTSAATAAKKTRNWHELFNQKRQKR
ncbi:hypothetical protein BJX99DRAFT_102023 [Aspergillus californicus]